MNDAIAKIIGKKSDRFRANPVRGLKTETAIDRTGGDKGAGLISGCAICTRGEALGHGYWLDVDFLAQVVSGINLRGGVGIKSRFAHPSESSDGLGTYLGRCKNAVLDGDTVRADLHFSPMSHETPDGDLASYVLGLAEDDPESFGISIVFQLDFGAMDLFEAMNEDEDGDFISPDPENVENFPHVRLAELRAADVVDDPAANPDGLFHRGAKIGAEADALLSFAMGLSEARPALANFDIDPDRAAQFVQRFMSNHGLSITKKESVMSTEPTAAPAPEVAQSEPAAASVPQVPCSTCGAMNDPGIEKCSACGAPMKPAEAEAPTEEPCSVPVEPAPAPQVAQQSSKSGRDYLDAFGTQGAVWFAEGKAWDEAQNLHAMGQADRIASLEAKINELEKKLSAVSWGIKPLAFNPEAESVHSQNGAGRPEATGAAKTEQNYERIKGGMKVSN